MFEGNFSKSKQSSLNTNGKCTKQELEVFRDNLKEMDEIEDE